MGLPKLSAAVAVAAVGGAPAAAPGDAARSAGGAQPAGVCAVVRAVDAAWGGAKPGGAAPHGMAAL